MKRYTITAAELLELLPRLVKSNRWFRIESVVNGYEVSFNASVDNNLDAESRVVLNRMRHNYYETGIGPMPPW